MPRQTVACYELVVSFVEATVSDRRAVLANGPMPPSVAKLRPQDQRLVMAAIAMCKLDVSGPQWNPVAVACSCVCAAFGAGCRPATRGHSLQRCPDVGSLMRQAYTGTNTMHHWYMHITTGAFAKQQVWLSRLLRAWWYKLLVRMRGRPGCHGTAQLSYSRASRLIRCRR